MTQRDLIQPHRQGSTPVGGLLSGRAARAIPTDLIREASKRLGIMSLLVAVLALAATVLWHIGRDNGGALRFSRLETSDGIIAAAAAVSLALFAYTRRTNRHPAEMLNLGLGYLVVIAFAIALTTHWGAAHSTSGANYQPEISWLGALVLIFAAIVPTSLRKTLIASLLAVSMNPLAMVIARSRNDLQLGAAVEGMQMHYPDYLLVFAAMVIARVVTRLGQHVSKAREMGSYQLGELLKRGGMGEVYKATHRMLARPAAIKLIRPEMLGVTGTEDAQLAVKRFYREAEAAASLRSPHTVEVFDFGVTEDQTLYFVMELLDGMDLDSMVQEYGPMPPSRAIFLLRQICESLDEAHAQGLIHRDIKPANIHVGRLGIQHDFVKVLDFGLVKSVEEETEVSLSTAVGRTPGTPAYMAPEMALGETVDGRADLYAVGCVAYFMVSGMLVFDGENVFQMMAKHLHHAPEPPSLRAGIAVAEQLERIILACLAKKPGDRPATASELRQLLGAVDIPLWREKDAAEWWKLVAAVGHA